ncbi:hypothetical protein FHR83_005944 [Actinoplanes campanulatus]|uniref:Protein kinase domain-containing protein n=1 Tax=Actinoplanes campanulatus TaxID=113559 RepID=A0A7W5ALZ5_9ACTN|nr:phosphotransferase [Actinoplanes campanulatus]MBB3098249.1 hypothetical protein [Actinoplanes campanulatus]GGN34748.1 hypothetical protein GCM10010109_58060 [Actinoplanes campanulatus]GID38792.1 hypothetical protein Aca09nite_52980 [Actinoplanes campanulatus]
MAGIDTPAGYTRLQRMSTGAEADLYQAWDERAGRRVALKLFHRFVRGRAEESAFAAHVAASVGLGVTAAIVPVRSGGITATGRPWLALDLIDGRTLDDVLRDRPPSPAEALHHAIILADALARTHSMRPQMVHGRIRPEAVLIGASGEPMLTGFAAPLGRTMPAPRDDVTALGALLFRVLTGDDWPGDIDRADRIISAWPGLSRLFDEVLTPVPAVDSMAGFAVRLRQVWHASGATIPLPASPGREITPTSPVVLPATPPAYVWKRRIAAMTLVAALPVAIGALLLYGKLTDSLRLTMPPTGIAGIVESSH